MSTSTKIATGFLTGTLFGATVALLYAPKKGTKTRKMLGEQAKSLSNTMERTYRDARHRMGLDHKEVDKVMS